MSGSSSASSTAITTPCGTRLRALRPRPSWPGATAGSWIKTGRLAPLTQSGRRSSPCPSPDEAVFESTFLKRETPEDDPGGKRKRRFGEVCRVNADGCPVQGIPSDDSWSCQIRHPPSRAGAAKPRRPEMGEPSSPHLRGLGVKPAASGKNPSPGASLHPARSDRRFARL